MFLRPEQKWQQHNDNQINVVWFYAHHWRLHILHLMIIIVIFPKGTLAKKTHSHTHIKTIAFEPWFENPSILNLNFKYWMIANEIQFSHSSYKSVIQKQTQIELIECCVFHRLNSKMKCKSCFAFKYCTLGRVKSRFSLNVFLCKLWCTYILYILRTPGCLYAADINSLLWLFATQCLRIVFMTEANQIEFKTNKFH